MIRCLSRLWCPLVPEVDSFPRLGRKLRVVLVGDQTILTSLALVNRELCLGLLERGDVELSLEWLDMPFPQLAPDSDPRLSKLFALRNAPLSGPPDITIRHHFPPNWLRPAHGKLIVMQPWEFAFLPMPRIEGAARADETWAYSRFVRDIYVRSGVLNEKLQVLPLGFNPEVFRRDGPLYPLKTRKKIMLLFVGGALERKGLDLLLDVYLHTFTRQDDVCLIIKDMGTGTVYQGQTLKERILRAAADPNAPEILYLEADLTDSELASLYRAATCLVHPYRAEGFALPPLEAAAMGIPSIVTAGGPTDDYLDNNSA